MAYRKLPNSVPTILRCLKTARDKWLETANPADRAITADHFAQLDATNPASLLERLLKEDREVNSALNLQGTATVGLGTAETRLRTVTSHFFQTLDFAIERGEHPAAIRTLYGRDINDTAVPRMITQDDLLDAAENAVSGEAERQIAEGANFVANTNPSAAQVATALTHYATARTQSGQATERTDFEREDVRALYDEALALAVDICDTVEFFYRKDPDASSRRQKSARWGVTYVYEEGEPQPPTPPTPPTP